MTLPIQQPEQADTSLCGLTAVTTRVAGLPSLPPAAHAFEADYETGSGLGWNRDKKRSDLIFSEHLQRLVRSMSPKYGTFSCISG
jgi:hypothetical protein